MAKLPSTVLAAAGLFAIDGYVPLKKLQLQFYRAGYGSDKANKWIEHYRDIEVLEISRDPAGEYMVSCIYWR